MKFRFLLNVGLGKQGTSKNLSTPPYSAA